MHPAAKQLDNRNNTDERSPKASNNGLAEEHSVPQLWKVQTFHEDKEPKFPVHNRRTSHSTNLSSPDIRAAKQLDDPSHQCQPPKSFTLIQERHTVRPVAKQRGGQTVLAKPELNVAPNPCNHLKQLHHAAKQLDDTVRQKLHPAAKQLDDRMPHKLLPNSITEANHGPALKDQPPISFDGSQHFCLSQTDNQAALDDQCWFKVPALDEGRPP